MIKNWVQFEAKNKTRRNITRNKQSSEDKWKIEEEWKEERKYEEERITEEIRNKCVMTTYIIL